MNAGSHIPWVPEVFFSLGATELSGEAAKASSGEREGLWYPGYITYKRFR